ncbi:GIY-YIG nuclease family protein [Vibrio marisflavi]|uniref:GIY-YIG domain-containing protein n=1 Tax=Vibrio marisflavi CECT 7928 TaxID=634439 RepID=A0ABM9A0B1_9VIBR|nr:GIY-YIG nuclease family protein [Vibrio marisflavi]CAH0536722.1 hypothetical protein VMF7928_00647 [Vibrio marisflavi CECT 7928]
MLWYVYLVRTSGGALYCGITTDIERRFKQHSDGTGAKALRGKGPLTLEFSYQVGSNRSQALKLEYAIKKLSKLNKELLVSNPTSIQQIVV